MSTPPLSPAHRAHLATSAIAEHVIAERGYYSEACSLRLPIYQLGNPVAYDAWFRPDVPSVDPETGKARKYLWPAGRPHVLDVLPRYAVRPDEHTPAPLYNRDIPLLVTEGCKKEDSLTSLDVAAVPVGLAGTWAWGKKNADGDMELLADWAHIPLRGRVVYLIFDSDAWRKESVNMALTELAEQLEARGAYVAIVRLPDLPDGSKAGIDDLIARGWEKRDIVAHASPWAGPDDTSLQLMGLGARLRTGNRLYAKASGELFRLEVGKSHLVKLTALAHAHERYISCAARPVDAPIENISARMASKLGGTKTDAGRWSNYAGVNKAIHALEKMEILKVDVAWNHAEGRYNSKATPGTFFDRPLEAPAPPKAEPRPKAVIVPTACSCCGSDHTQISRVCHAEGCAEPVTMFYDGTVTTPIRDDRAIKDLREKEEQDLGISDPQGDQYAMIAYWGEPAPEPAAAPTVSPVPIAPHQPRKHPTPIHAWYAAMRAGNRAQASAIEAQHPTAADWVIEQQVFASQRGAS